MMETDVEDYGEGEARQVEVTHMRWSCMVDEMELQGG